MAPQFFPGRAARKFPVRIYRIARTIGVLFSLQEMPTRKHSSKPRTIRRSVALPSTLVDELSALAPDELRGNWNELVTLALREYAARCRALVFETQMAAMAADPGIEAECAIIAKEFSVADLDGVRHS